jgi:hypothetical protein
MAILGHHLWVRSPQLGRTLRVLLHADKNEQAHDLRQSLADCTEVTFIIPGDFLQFSNAYLRTVMQAIRALTRFTLTLHRTYINHTLSVDGTPS